eukprot:gb/GECG01006748.1/.p1 GENE.gb/GECG01006748.1/~~gb/GECG01006748.1/.p1  ORF type:complete len:117 (+),score=4.51 gb/GECG01006748.1/:1-351(+)
MLHVTCIGNEIFVLLHGWMGFGIFQSQVGDSANLPALKNSSAGPQIRRSLGATYVNDCGIESCEQFPPHRMYVVRSLNIAAMTRSLITTQTTLLSSLSSLVSVTMDIIVVAGSSVG